MAFPAYKWPLVDKFLDRAAERTRLEEWWVGSERMPVNLYGRRRVGKSWLLRRFAHGKPAVLLVAERLAPGAQLARFAGVLAPLQGGVVPDLPDVATLLRTLFRLARNEPLLAVIDEFPWLLGTTQPEVERTLSAIQAVMEDERDASKLKLIVCGSAVAQMEAMQSERNPLHGRLIRLEIRPLDLGRAAEFLPGHDPVGRFERYAISGGMPRYLAAVGSGRLKDAVCQQILQPDAPLWNEGRTIVGQELREPAVHFAVLEELAAGEKEMGEIAGALRLPGGTVSKYLSTLESLRLVSRRLPLGASPTARGGHWVLGDPFLRFWFRFVFPYQADLEAGLAPADLFDTEISPALAGHIAPMFEDACRAHARHTFGTTATRVGRWWGNALHALRRSGDRSSEEIDIVGMARGRVTLIGEAKWTTAPMGPTVLRDLERYKVPALHQAGFKLATNARTVLYCKAGFTKPLRNHAASDARLSLVDGAEVLLDRT
jgi:AAA+ ATPase superfamily predicted ATPase